MDNAPSDSPISLEAELALYSAGMDYLKLLESVLGAIGRNMDEWRASEPEYLYDAGSPFDGMLKNAYAKMISEFCNPLLAIIGPHSEIAVIALALEATVERIVREQILAP